MIDNAESPQKRSSRQGTRIDTQQPKSKGNCKMTPVQQADQQEQFRLELIRRRDEDNLTTARAILDGTYVLDDDDGYGSKVDVAWWVQWARMIIRNIGTGQDRASSK